MYVAVDEAWAEIQASAIYHVRSRSAGWHRRLRFADRCDPAVFDAHRLCVLGDSIGNVDDCGIMQDE